MTSPSPGFALADAAALIQALPSPVALVYMDSSLVLNAAARARLAQVGGAQDWAALFHAESLPRVQEALRRAFQGETGHVSVRLADAVAPGLVTVAPAGPGAALMHLHSARDPLEVALELLDGLGLGLTVQAQDSQILFANRAAQDILGLDFDQLTGRDSLDPRWRAIHPNGAAFPGDSHPAVQALRSGEVLRRVPMGVFHPPSEAWRWLSVTAVPRRLPGAAQPQQVMTVFEDTTDLHQTQAALQQSERRFRSLVEATAQIVWTADPDGFFSPPQAGWEAFTGQTPAEYEGQGWLAVLHPDDRAHTLAAWNAAVQTSTLYATRHRLRRQSGEYIAMQVRAVPVLDDQGAVQEWVGVHNDVRAVQAAEQTLRNLNSELEARVQERTGRLAEVTRFSTLLLTAAGEGVFGLDAAGRTTFANPAVGRMLGYPVESMIGSEQHALIHHHHEDGRPYPLGECPIHQTLRDGQVRRVDADVFWHAQGHAVPVAYIVTPTTDEQGAVTGAVVMVQDITERQQAQRALQAAVTDLERSNHDLEQFAYVAGHDLQEPLRTLGNYTHLFTRRYRGQLDAHADQYLNFIQGAVERMHSMIQDLLAFARVGQNEGAQRTLSLDALLRAAEQNVHAALQDSGGQLIWDTPHSVRGQASLLTQLLTNLIGNALKFSRPGLAPEVRVTSQAVGGHVQVSVQDNGIGIAPEYAERVFEIFQRLHQRDSYAGNGMGLAICRRIVEHHGGRLWLESVPGQGSTFHFTLPSVPHPHD